MTDNEQRQAFNYVVGEEKRLSQIIFEEDVTPIIRGIIRAGASRAAVTDENGDILWGSDGEAAQGFGVFDLPLLMEGEVVGRVSVWGGRENEDLLRGLAEIFQTAVMVIITSKLKRMLTAEIHSTVVSRSYEELLEINQRLSASEERYRNLAANLEIKVEERTEELKRAHVRLMQQEKLASIGQLASGVAHEINNPLGFIHSNLQTLDKYVLRFMDMLDFFRSAINGSAGNETLKESGQRKWDELKLDLICTDVAELIEQSLLGAQRVKKIVSDLKAFSHVDEIGECQAMLNDEIEKTLTVVGREMPEGTEIIRNYGELPSFVCKPALLCQVFLNLFLNAFQARREGLRLIITTIHDGDDIRISFADNGPGIPQGIRNRIFEPFFTTRDVGSGSGMGLTVTHDIISAYGGTIEVDCPQEGGAVFNMTLPVKRII